MQDIEFILNPKTTLRRLCFYPFKTGVFKAEVLTKVMNKFGCETRTPENFIEDIRSSCLFGHRNYFLQITNKEEFKKILPGLRIDCEDKIFVSLPEEVFTPFSEEFKTAQKITEADKTKNNFQFFLQFLLKVTNTPETVKESIPVITTDLENLYNKSEDISSFLLKAEEALLVCLQQEDDKYVWERKLFNTFLPVKETIKYFQLHEQLYFFLTQPTTESKDILFTHLCSIYTEVPESRFVISAIYRAIFDLMLINSQLSQKNTSSEFKNRMLKKYANISTVSLLKFSLTLSETEASLNTSEFIPAMSSFLQKTQEYLLK
jgi:hypothetical protein